MKRYPLFRRRNVIRRLISGLVLIAMLLTTSLATNSPTAAGSTTPTPTPEPVGPHAMRSGFEGATLAPNDDGSTTLVDIGFPINYFGTTYNQLFVNNNGNVTFGSTLATFTPFNIVTAGRVIITPFFADVDTRATGQPTRYGTGTVDGRPAFGATWRNVDYYYGSTSHTNRNHFQVVLIERTDTGPGNFDIEFNYDQIQWETGTASGGDANGLGGGSARAGYSNGTTAAFELPGSGVNGAFLDGNALTGLAAHSLNSPQPGRYLFQVRGGIPPAVITTDMVTLNAGAGATSNVTVQNLPAVGLKSYTAMINFNPAVVTVGSVGDGDAPFGAPTTKTIDNVAGTVTLAGSQTGATPSGSIVVARLNLQGVANGATPLGINGDTLIDTTSAPIVHTVTPGAATVTTPVVATGSGFVPAGFNIDIPVEVRGLVAQTLAAYDITISFDKTKTTINSVNGGPAPFGHPASTIDNTAGTVTLSQTVGGGGPAYRIPGSLDESAPITDKAKLEAMIKSGARIQSNPRSLPGTVTLAILNVQGVSAGATDLAIVVRTLANSNQGAITHTTSAGTVTVAAPTPTPTPAPSPSPTPTPGPTSTPSPTPAPTATPTPTPTPSPSPTGTPTPIPQDYARVEAGNAVAGSGGTVNIPVSIMNVLSTAGLGAYDITINYNPAIITLSNVIGASAPFDGAPTKSINNTAGQVVFNAFQGGTRPGPTGDIVVANLVVNAVGTPGQIAPLTVVLKASSVSDTDGNNLLSAGVNGSVTIFGADFTASPTQGPAPLTVQFTDRTAGIPNGPQAIRRSVPTVVSDSWTWDFGDGTTSSSRNPQHTYPQGGNYTVSLTTTSGSLSDTRTRTNYIQVIQAQFHGTPTGGTKPLTVVYHDDSLGTVNSWAWTFGDGTTSTAQHPTTVYNNAGTHNVALTVTGPAGTSSLTKTAYINVAEIKHTPGFSQVIGADGIVYLNININRIYNPSTGLDQQANGGIAAYDLTLSYPGGTTGDAVNIMAVKGMAPFSSPTAGTVPSTSGTLNINSFQTGSAPQAPLTLAQVAPRIIGSSAVSQNIVLTFATLADVAAGADMPADGTKTYIVKRGDARQDGVIAISDALFIAQTLAGLRDVGEGTTFTHAVNGASVKLETTTTGEKLTIADALLIAQKLAGLRDDSFN